MAEELRHEVGDERLVLARQSGELIGQGRLYFDLVQNTDKGHLHVGVTPGARRRGVGRRLAGALAREALRPGRTRYTAGTSSRSLGAEVFAAGLGARASLLTTISELHLDRLDRAQLRAWADPPVGVIPLPKSSVHFGTFPSGCE